MKIRVDYKYIWVCVYIYLIFHTTLQNTTTGLLKSVISYSDDLICIIILFFAIVRLIKLKRFSCDKYEKYAVLFYCCFILWGILSASIYELQRMKYVFLDAFTCCKFIVVYFSVRILVSRRLDDKYFFHINALFRVVAIILFSLTIHDLLFTPYFEKGEFRLFTYSIKLFFYHPESLARACAGVIYPLAYNMKKYKNNIWYILMMCIVMFFTFRMKSIAAMLIFVLLYLYMKLLKGKYIWWLLCLAVMVGFLVGAKQMQFYFSMPEIGRTKLVTDSIKLAKEYFPFGTGFGTFGSNVALEHNSLLYVQMGYFDIRNRWAIKEYLNDAFWPIVLAQSGFVGTLLFLSSIVCLLLMGIHYYKKDFEVGWVFLMILLYDLISTLGSSAFCHPMALAGYLFAGMIVSTSRKGVNRV